MNAVPKPLPVLDLSLPDLTATRALAGRLADLARVGDVLALAGDLGSGKTEFARAFIRRLADDDVEVPSPTFTLVQTYSTAKAEIWHFDLYRLDGPEDTLELGMDEAFADGISLIEWPDRLGAELPADALKLNFRQGSNQTERRVTIDAPADWADRLVEAGL